jgi:3-oxoacyl-[acyl-carrier protein] reductase
VKEKAPMSDTYLRLVNSGTTKSLAKKLGLPRPAVLRRYEPGQPLVTGPVLVLGGPSDPLAGTSTDADAVAKLLLAWDLDVRRHPSQLEKGGRWGAVVVVLTDAVAPGDLSAPVLALASTLRTLAPSGRVVTVSRAAATSDAPAVAATRQGVDGILRSLAKELRAGATGNGIVLAGDATLAGPSVASTLRFLLSAKSAFVDGQLMTVGSDAGTLPGDATGASWDAPLAGKVAVVTGAARGIGAEIARVLARDGATLVCVDVPAAGDALAKVANEVRGTALQVDITSDDAGARILEHAVGRHGSLDVVIHNAGITRDKLLANMTPDKWDAVVAVNIAAQLRIDDYLLASGQFEDAPRIVSLASTSGIAGNRGQTNYSASKAGVIGMVRATGPLLAPFGGTANAVAPGFIETDMTAHIPAVTRQIARRLDSLQQGGLPVDVAETVAFLASPAAGGINGQTLRVCGQNLVGQ